MDRPEDLSHVADGRHRIAYTGPAQGEACQRASLPDLARVFTPSTTVTWMRRWSLSTIPRLSGGLEKVSYAAAYGGERIPAYLFLPKNGKPPYQAMVVFPGANALYTALERQCLPRHSPTVFNFIMRSGRALLYPVYKSTYERGDGED